MNDELIADLKQFILATVSQATADLVTKDDLDGTKDLLEKKIDGLHGEMDGLRAHMDARFDELKIEVVTIADAHAEMLEDHAKRITRLEHRAA